MRMTIQRANGARDVISCAGEYMAAQTEAGDVAASGMYPTSEYIYDEAAATPFRKMTGDEMAAARVKKRERNRFKRLSLRRFS